MPYPWARNYGTRSDGHISSIILYIQFIKDITFFLNDRVPLVLTGDDYVIKYSGFCFVLFQIGYENQTGK